MKLNRDRYCVTFSCHVTIYKFFQSAGKAKIDLGNHWQSYLACYDFLVPRLFPILISLVIIIATMFSLFFYYMDTNLNGGYPSWYLLQNLLNLKFFGTFDFFFSWCFWDFLFRYHNIFIPSYWQDVMRVFRHVLLLVDMPHVSSGSSVPSSTLPLLGDVPKQPSSLCQELSQSPQQF